VIALLLLLLLMMMMMLMLLWRSMMSVHFGFFVFT